MKTPAIILCCCATLCPVAAAPKTDFNLPTGSPMELTIGGDALTHTSPGVDARLEALKAIGFRSIQTYVYWNKVEKTRGVLDWSEYDADVELYQRHGLKWVPFVIVGPWYLTPEFVRRDPKLAMLRCLEHDRDSAIPSLWSPALKDYVRTYLAQFAEHYRPRGVIESIDLGISGDYGEAIYSVIGNWPGEYHSHNGYWCGDSGAIEDFRKRMRGRYPQGIGSLNQAWRAHYESFEELRPFGPTAAPSERAWQEMLAWYRGAMTDYAAFCLATSRELFPTEAIYLCTGGDMAPEHGSDFSAQAKIAAQYGAGIRITNEASSFPMNVRLTRMVGSACRHYGGYAGHEPASVVTPVGMLGRLFNAASSGARQFFTYDSDEVMEVRDGQCRPGPAGEFIRRYRDVMKTTQPIIDTAFYAPNPLTTDTWTDRDNFSDLVSQIRRFIDYDFVDDHLIADGALNNKSILIVANTKLMAAESMDRIARWVEQGGIVYFLASRASDWDGQFTLFDRLAGLTAQSDEVSGITDLVVAQPKVLPAIAAMKSVTVFQAYSQLAADCVPLIDMAYNRKLRVAWRRPVGAGQVFAFYGPMDLKVPEMNWTTAHQLPLHFIRDTLEHCVAEGWLKSVPPTLNLANPELYKVQTSAGLLLLNMKDTAQVVSVRGEKVEVPAHSILRK